MAEPTTELEEKQETLGVWELDLWQLVYPKLTSEKFTNNEQATPSFQTSQGEGIDFILEDVPEKISHFGDKVLGKKGQYKRRLRKTLTVEIALNGRQNYDCFAQIFSDDQFKNYRGVGQVVGGKLTFSNWEEEGRDSKGAITYRDPTPLDLTFHQARNLTIKLEKK